MPDSLLRPSLTRPLAIGASLAFSTSYVGVLYVFSTAQLRSNRAIDEHGQLLDRNHPRIIKRRLWSVAASSVASLVGVWALARRAGFVKPSSTALSQVVETLRWIGISWPQSASTALKTALLPLAVTASLFAGPIYSAWLDGQLWGREDVRSLRGFRNVVAAPILEELVFRACICSVGLMAHLSKRHLIFVTPVYFGLAHVHHAWDVYVSGGRTRNALVRGLVGAAFQFSYTYLMGMYGAFLFLRTGSLAAPVLAHAFANYCGLPDPVGSTRAHPRSRAAIYSLYGAGIVAFACSLVPATDPALYGGSPFW